MSDQTFHKSNGFDSFLTFCQDDFDGMLPHRAEAKLDFNLLYQLFLCYKAAAAVHDTAICFLASLFMLSLINASLISGHP